MLNKISMADLVQFQDGDKMDIESHQSDANSAYAVTRDEVARLMELKRNRKRSKADVTEGFYELPSKSALERSINRILHHKEAEDPATARARANFKYEFDRKMSRIKRIKSKSYRRIRRISKKKEESLGAELETEQAQPGQDEVSVSRVPDRLLKRLETSEEEEGTTPIFSFGGPSEPKAGLQEEMVRLAFGEDAGDNEKDFVEEKEDVINEEAPKIQEIVLPGWGSWGGAGMEITKTRYNTIVKCKEGIKHSNRRDFNVSHVIINEKTGGLDKRYKAILPYGYTKEQYQDIIRMPVSKERNTLRIFKKLVRPRADETGMRIRQFHYEKEDIR
jgi:U3 small nucleolar RNA-associated protein 14